MVMMKLQMTQVQAMNNKVAIFSDLHLGVHQNSSFWIDVALNWVKWFKQDLHNKGIKDIGHAPLNAIDKNDKLRFKPQEPI